MTSSDGIDSIVFNGEIYNFLELRAELEAKGHHFKTHSDTEVILIAYRQWGADCVKHLQGMFAFAIADLNKQEVLLARDCLGIKPLVYLEKHGKCTAFSSEIQALLPAADSDLSVDLEAIDQYLWLQYIPAPLTAYKEIRKLPPAHLMIISMDGDIKKIERYWDPAFAPVRGRSESDWIDGLDDVLKKSVKAHLVSDVPFGAFLSGGIDSSQIVAYMATLLETRFHTFTIGFGDQTYSEAPNAEKTARHWNTIHHTQIVDPDNFDFLPDLVRNYGEPFGDSSAIPTYFLSRLAREHVPMVLSGDGGDELFGGYETYRHWKSNFHPIPASLEGKARKLLQIIRSAVRDKSHAILPSSSLKNWLSLVNYMSAEHRLSLWKPEFRNLVDSAKFVAAESAFDKTKKFSHLHKAQFTDIHTYLPFDILTKVDTASMMNSLEVRTPIVDRCVAEYALTIPETMAIRSVDGTIVTKWLLKQLSQKYYPSGFLETKKMGFSIPIQRIYERSQLGGVNITERLFAKDSLLLHFFQRETLVRIAKKGPPHWIWQLLVLDEWFRQNPRISLNTR